MRFCCFHTQSRYARALCRWVLFPLLFSATAARGQQVTLSVKDLKIDSVFEQIKKQTGYSFLYTSEEIKEAKPLTLSIQNLSLPKALAIVFNGQPLQYSIEENYVVVRAKVEEKRETFFLIEGRVLNDRGESIYGASVSLKNTTTGIATNERGEFRIRSREPNVTLLVTSVGYEGKELNAVAHQPTIIFLTPAGNKLDEQIVIAYGSTTRRVSTGTVSKIKADEIGKQPVDNLLMALSGRVSGLQITQTAGTPGSNVTVLLRGRNSLASGNDPLYLIDGVPFPSSTLTSSYGGGAGTVASPLNNLNPLDVESIEVLKDADATAIYGSRGANGVILITTKKGKSTGSRGEVSFYKGFGQVTRLMTLLNTPEYLAMRREAFANDGVLPTVANARDLLQWDTTRSTDWQNVLLGQRAAITDIYSSFSGGSASTQFMIGAGYHKETTVFSQDFGEDKISTHYSLTHSTINQKFKLSFQGNFVVNKNLLPQADFTTLITLPPNAPALYDTNGNLNWENSTWVNPLSNLQKKYKATTENFGNRLSLEWNVLKNLSVKASVGYTNIQMDEIITTPLKSYDPAQLASAIAYAGFGTNRVKTFIAEPQVNYAKRMGSRWNLQLLVGSTFQETTQSKLLQTGVGYTNDELIQNLKAAPTVTVDNTDFSQYRYVGIFSRLNIDYKRTYILNLTARRDGSSRFGPNNRFSTFGSAGIAWIFTNEKWFSGLQSVLNYGKLKASYGLTGNDQIGDYRYLDTYTSYSYSYQGMSPLYPTRLFNPDFGWEQVKKSEVGIDLSFLKDRVLASVNFYSNRTGNQLVSYPLATTTGFSGVLMNIPATIQNQGWEFEVSSVNKKSKFFEWTSALTLTVPRNRLLSYPGLEKSSYANSYVVGQSLFIDKRFHATGVDSQTGIYSFQDYDKDGKITSPNDQQAIVFTGQQYYGGLQNDVKYKGWSLSLFVQFVRQKAAPNYFSRYSRPGTMSNQPKFVMDRWQKPGDGQSIQKFSNSNTLANTAFTNIKLSDAAYSDASFARVKNIQFAYKVPNDKLPNWGLTELKFFVEGQNVITLTNYKGLDPETRSVQPPLKVITGGVRVGF